MTIDKLEYTVKRSNRKTVAIRFECDGKVTVLAPLNAGDRVIEMAVKNNADWISKKSDERQKHLIGKNTDPITDDQIADLKSKAMAVLPALLDRWASKLGVSYNKFSVRKMYSRWGSCSADKNISINCLLMLAPDSVINYIIVHELSHLRYMDHSKDFYTFVDSHFSYRKECQRWLKDDGVLIVSRARHGEN